MLFFILACADVGATFLDWSLHYLSGNDTYWQNKKNKWIELRENPLTKNNAHYHEKNILSGDKEILKFWNNISNFTIETGKLYSFRLEPQYETLANDWIKFLPLICKKHKLIYLQNRDFCNPLLVRGVEEYTRGLDLRAKEDRNILYKSMLLRLFDGKKISKNIDTGGKMRNFIFFNLKNLRKNYNMNLESLKLENFYQVDHEDFLNFPENTIRKIFYFLDLKLEETKLKQWCIIHFEWKKFFIPAITFNNDLQKICYHIKNKLSFDLKKYDLDLFQEAIIMKHFFESFNSFLKVGSLNTFPDDTIKLQKYF